MMETVSTENKRTVDKNRDSKGCFIKGNNANPKGNNQFLTIVPLLNALKKSGQKYKEDFWDMVARKIRTSDTVLIAILKKLLPDKIEGQGIGADTKIIIVRSNNKKEQNVKKSGQNQSIVREM